MACCGGFWASCMVSVASTPQHSPASPPPALGRALPAMLTAACNSTRCSIRRLTACPALRRARGCSLETCGAPCRGSRRHDGLGDGVGDGRGGGQAGGWQSGGGWRCGGGRGPCTKEDTRRPCATWLQRSEGWLTGSGRSPRVLRAGAGTASATPTTTPQHYTMTLWGSSCTARHATFTAGFHGAAGPYPLLKRPLQRAYPTAVSTGAWLGWRCLCALVNYPSHYETE